VLSVDHMAFVDIDAHSHMVEKKVCGLHMLEKKAHG